MAQPLPNWPTEGHHMAIYCAALTGFVANRHFHDGYYQGSPVAAHEFALRAVHVAFHGEEPSDGR